MSDKPIFHDVTGKRATRVAIVGWTVVVISAALGLMFLTNLMVTPRLAHVRLPGDTVALRVTRLSARAQKPGLVPQAEQLAAEALKKKKERLRQARIEHQISLHVRKAAKPADVPISAAFYPDWVPSAYDSLKVALPHLDWIMPTWLSLRGPNLELKDSYNQNFVNLVHKNPHAIAILPVIQNATLGNWDGDGFAKLLADRKRSEELVATLTQYLEKHRLQGVVADFESLPTNSYSHYAQFLEALSAAFKPHGWKIVLATPFDDDKWPVASFARYVDYTLLMAYDEHLTPHEPGSIAGQAWFENTLDHLMHQLDPAKTIVALGNYAYDWNGDDINSLSFEEAVIAAHDSAAPVQFDAATNNPYFSYVEDDHSTHTVWFLDAVTAFNQIRASDPYRPAGYALWRLGSEDPSIWSVMGRPYNATAPPALRNIPIIEDIDYEGSGEMIRVEAHPQSGARRFETDPVTGDINYEAYTKLPTGYVIRQFGAQKKKIALTFDDGPDPEWTPQILDILKQKKVPATFFIIGSNAQANPDLVQRMVDEGHVVGNHTYTHPDLSLVAESVVPLELNATQRLFEALTGHSMRLFRPPYIGDAEPTDAQQIVPVEIAQNMGYITVGEHIDPLDWARPGVPTIVARAMAQVHATHGNMPRNIILFHDAGGDRSQTVEALPIVIDRLKAEGYSFVPISSLAGLTREQIMPPLSPTVSFFTDRIVFYTLSAGGHILYYCFFAAVFLGVARMLFLIIFSLRHGRTSGQPAGTKLPVSVVIPAYNEATVIVSTVKGVLASKYADFDVIVVDDGSTDDTLGVLRAHYSDDLRVSIMAIPNGGKANALNIGIASAKGEVIVALDADTQFEPTTIPSLVRWFDDPTIGAVAGNAKVGNRINMITRWQALEYIVAQNLERRALAGLGAFTVVPGAVGAWRRSAITEAGGFRTDTMAEDQDLTIQLQKFGYRVVYDDAAIAWTEAPADFRGLAKQRFRWAFGTLQCLWKYRALLMRPRYGALGMVALPQAWMFQVFLTALGPFADLLLIWQLLWQGIAWLQHGSEFSNTDLMLVGVYYIAFVLVDMLAAISGFFMERREDWKLLLWLPLQRFGYRQLMYYVVLRSISAAIRGALVGWGKLERTATVTVAPAE